MKGADWLGWLSSMILLLTIGRQVFIQWRDKQSQGMSRWLFIGQLVSSMGYTVYSALLHNWVFLVSNLALLITAVAGQAILVRNRRQQPCNKS